MCHSTCVDISLTLNNESSSHDFQRVETRSQCSKPIQLTHGLDVEHHSGLQLGHRDGICISKSRRQQQISHTRVPPKLLMTYSASQFTWDTPLGLPIPYRWKSGIDAVIMPVVSRNTIKRGNKRVVKLGDKEIVLNDPWKSSQGFQGRVGC